MSKISNKKTSDNKTTKNDFQKGFKQGIASWLIRELLEAFFN
ncbi:MULTISPECIES: hypothetical protein [Pseudoalteromonas]|nr:MULTISPECIES: hypothetical protein [Pseudoalteromonas]